jgi:hypothetical protein
MAKTYSFARVDMQRRTFSSPARAFGDATVTQAGGENRVEISVNLSPTY